MQPLKRLDVDPAKRQTLGLLALQTDLAIDNKICHRGDHVVQIDEGRVESADVYVDPEDVVELASGPCASCQPSVEAAMVLLQKPSRYGHWQSILGSVKTNAVVSKMEMYEVGCASEAMINRQRRESKEWATS